MNLPQIEVFDFVIGTTKAPAKSAPLNTGSRNSNKQRDDETEAAFTTIATLVSAGSLPAQIDLVKISTGDSDLEVANDLASIRPAVVQLEFSSEDPMEEGDHQTPGVSKAETIKAMLDLGDFWNIILFRVESEDFVRMATNLAGTPKRSWGKIFFFQDYQLFLKAHHWCKGALPRFQANTLTNR
jgi:hypothetical protein